jgi:electron transport complex protein RnfC
MMILKKRSFSGGVHPHEYKEYTDTKPTEKAGIPAKIILPLSQNLGAPAKPLVKVGDKVTVGQKIAEPQGFVSVPLHSSITGKVVEISNHLHPNGHMALSIVIEKEGDDQEFPMNEVKNWDSLPKEKILESIKEAGIVGFGGATFPTHVKLNPPKEKPIDAVILNGAECEPYLTSDHRLMLEKPLEIIEGLKILMKVTGAAKGYVGIENNKKDAAEVLSEAAKDRKDIQIVVVKVKYPQGGEKQLIKSILNRRVPPPPGLPMDVGVVVQNVATSAAVYDAVRFRKPFIERVITITGKGIKTPKNLLARIGTPLEELVKECGGLRGKTEKIIMGGPMMGLPQVDINVPVIKGTSGILILRKEDIEKAEEHPCIKCGRCVQVCPMNLIPSKLARLSEVGEFDTAEKMFAMACIECGSCSFICPAKIWLVQKIKYAKAEINARKKAS